MGRTVIKVAVYIGGFLVNGGFPLGEHFNLPHHNGIWDMRVSVFRRIQGGTAAGQRGEMWLIFRLGTLAPIDSSSLKSISSLNKGSQASAWHFQVYLRH